MKATAHSQVKEHSANANASGVRVTSARTISTTVEVITPEVAAQMLERNTANRPLSRAVITKYAADMADGRWTYNGQDILFSADGDLLDGQHRLSAIIQADTPVALGVKRGLSSAVFDTIDAGKTRTAGDVLALMGEPYYALQAAAARIALSYTMGRAFADPYLTRRQVTDFAVANPYLLEAARLAATANRRLNPSPLAAIIFLANERRFFDDQIGEFLDGVITGAGLSKGDPRLTLRDWAVSERLRTRGRLPAPQSFTAIARAWTAFVRAENLKLIKVVRRPTRETVEIVGFHAPAA